MPCRTATAKAASASARAGCAPSSSIVLPTAIPGILAGVILAIGRIVGETAALIYTAGTVSGPDRGRACLSPGAHARRYTCMCFCQRGVAHSTQAYATAAVLLIVVVVINAPVGALWRKSDCTKRRGLTWLKFDIKNAQFALRFLPRPQGRSPSASEPNAITALIGPSGCGKSQRCSKRSTA